MIYMAEPTYLGRELLYTTNALYRRALSHGEYVERFEAEWARICGTKYAVACSSGTAALHLALVACGVGKGHRVAVPTLTYAATANAVLYTGATVVLTDVSDHSWVMYPGSLLGKRVDLIVPVHLYGVISVPGFTPAIEDACEAHGASLIGNRVAGSLGCAAAFSFYGNKILTTGEGGMVTTNDLTVATKVRHLRSMATVTRYTHDDIGFNYRMTNLQGAIGLGQAEMIVQHLAHRQALQDLYKWHLSNQPKVRLQTRPPGSAPWVFPVRVKNRDRVAKALAERGIETRPVFTPLHLQAPWSGLAGAFPVAEAIAREGLLLPTHAGMTDRDVHQVCDTLLEVL